MNQQQQQYVFELNEHDVLCGRGSGPNDRVGNIEFRNLVLSRKAEYLAAPSRDAKGRIASSIVDTVRGRGGRFLRKLSPAQAKDAGFKRGTTVYELADEVTVLEKAKQTLRQNRADFVKEHGVPIPKIDFGGDGSETPRAPSSGSGGAYHQQGMSQSNQNGGGSSVQGSMNPYPLDASGGLDSMQRPNFSARTAEQLNKALFTSSNISGITNPSMTNGMGSGNQSGMQMGSTSSGNTNNYSILSMNTTELCAAMGGSSNFMSQNSTTSSQAYGNLLKEYNTQEEQQLMQQFEQLKAQSQMLLQQQQVLQQQQQHQQQQQQMPQSNPYQSNMQFNQRNQQDFNEQPRDPKGAQQQQGGQQNSDVFDSLVRQYTEGGGQAAAQKQPRDSVSDNHHQQRSFGMSSNNNTASNNVNNASKANNIDDLAGTIIRRLSTDDQQKLLQQFQQLQQQQLMETMAKQQSQQTHQQQQQQPSHQVQREASSSSHQSRDNNFVARAMDSQATLQTSHMGSYNMDSKSSINDSWQPIKIQRRPSRDRGGSPSYTDSSIPLNDCVPSKKQSSTSGDEDSSCGDEVNELKFDPSRRRAPTQRSRYGRSNQATNAPTSSMMSSTNSMGTNASLRLSHIEPCDLMADDSLRLSFLTANKLAKTLEDNNNMSNNMSAASLGASGLGASGNWGRNRANRMSYKDNLDSSMLSLMSMSLSELPNDAMPPDHGDSAARGGGESPSKVRDKILAKQPSLGPTGLTVEKKEGEDARFGESVMSLGNSLDDDLDWYKD